MERIKVQRTPHGVGRNDSGNDRLNSLFPIPYYLFRLSINQLVRRLNHPHHKHTLHIPDIIDLT
jgi:hypothetical protein